MGKENQNSRNLEAILTPELKNFYIKARRESYTGTESIFGSNKENYSQLEWTDGKSDYHYLVNLVNIKDCPGKFHGFEIISESSNHELQILKYNYSGRLTSAGFEVGREKVYAQLKNFLQERSADVRFGKDVRGGTWCANNQWKYKSDGEIHDWGWEDREQVSLNDKLVYELRGAGISFIR